MSELARRRLLAVTGTALTGAVAGCTGSSDDAEGNGSGNGDGNDGDGGEATGDGGGEPAGTILGNITIDNLDDTNHTVDIIVEFDREIEDWTTEELEATGGATVERNWPSEPGRFRVTTRLDRGDPIEVTPARWNAPPCLNLFVRIDREGTLSVLSDTTSGPCGGGGDGDATGGSSNGGDTNGGDAA